MTAVSRHLGGARVAAWCVLALTVFADFHYHSTNVMLELPLMTSMALGILAAVRASTKATPAAVVGFAVATGAAFMIKGPPAAALFVVPCLLAWRRGLGWRLPVVMVALGCAVSVGCALGLDAWRAALGLPSFWATYFTRQVLASVVDGRAGSSGPLFYVDTLVKFELPLLFALPLAAYALKTRRPPVDLLLLGALWCAAILGGFSIPRQKYNWYIAPMLPGAAWLLGGAVSSLIAARLDVWAGRAAAAAAVVWVVSSGLYTRELTGARADIAVLTRLPPPHVAKGPLEVANCSRIDLWRGEHLFAFHWQARALRCEEWPGQPGSLRFDGQTLEPNPTSPAP